MAIATTLFWVILAYAAVGVLYAFYFAFRKVDRIDPGAAEGTLGFRLLILPGVSALWPLFVLRSSQALPTERTAHRRRGESP